jgi:Protein of unknown function (DUF2934)
MASRRPTDSPRTTGPTETAGKSPSPEKKPPSVRKPRAKKAVVAAALPPAEISEDARRGMIAEAAYLRAERRGFAPGYEAEDWLSAEAEVDALLRADHTSSPQ